MSWTNPRIGMNTLFDDTVLPLHEKLERDRGTLFPLGPDLSLDSYYIRRGKTRMNHEDFEVAAYEDAAGFARALRNIWQNENGTELAGSIEMHAEVARALADVAEQQTDEVSSCIYVMF